MPSKNQGIIEKFVYCAIPTRIKGSSEEIMTYVIGRKHIPILPFAVFPYNLFEGGSVGRKNTMAACRELVKFCSQSWVFGISKGVLGDIAPAINLNKRIELHLEFDPEWEKYAEILRSRPKYRNILNKLV